MSTIQPSMRVTIGVALMLFSSVLLGTGIHHLIATGTCSSSGYSQYGPVPTCPSGTGTWMWMVTGGILGDIAGSMIAGSASLVFATIFPAIGFGALTLAFDKHAPHFAKSFGLLFGAGFAATGVIAAGAMLGSVVRSIRRSSASPPPGKTRRSSRRAGRGRRQPRSRDRTVVGAPQPSPAPGVGLMGLGASSAPAAAATAGSQSAGILDQIGRLNDLRNSGVLTDAEFDSEKTKLLGQL